MEHNMLSLDFWQDTVTYEGKTMPTGTIGCDTLNIPDDVISELDALCAPLNNFIAALNVGEPDAALLQPARESAIQIFERLRPVPPFSYLDTDFYINGISNAFTSEGLENLLAYTNALMSGGMSAERMGQYQKGILIGRLTPVLAQLGFSLGEFKKTMLNFAKKMDAPDSSRTPDGLAALFGRQFPPEFSLTEESTWMSHANITVQYLSTIRPGCDIPTLVKRMHFVSFVGMLRADLFEGLCVGHAPKQCPICGRWFLTTNARHTKYCGNLAPGDRLGRTCRQLGNLRGREQRELAADHPLKQVYERRLNTINRYVSRGKLNKGLAAAMKKLAKDKMLRAISDNAYAKSGYVPEMEQDALLAEAKAKL